MSIFMIIKLSPWVFRTATKRGDNYEMRVELFWPGSRLAQQQWLPLPLSSPPVSQPYLLSPFPSYLLLLSFRLSSVVCLSCSWSHESFGRTISVELIGIGSTSGYPTITLPYRVFFCFFAYRKLPQRRSLKPLCASSSCLCLLPPL